MTTEKLIDAIGLIDEKYIADAISPQIEVKHGSMKKWAVAVAALVCLAAPLPKMKAYGIDAYEILYHISPSIAQSFKPVCESCESNGIRMEVISGEIYGSRASFYISLQGEKIDATTDLFDSYNIRCPFDNFGHVSFSHFDEETKTAYFLVEIQTMNGEEIHEGKVTFSLRELIMNKKSSEGIIEGISLDDVPINPPTKKNINYRGYSDMQTESFSDYSYLIPDDEPIELTDGVYLTGLGYIDNALHIQTYYEDIHHTDNHGFVYLMDKDGNLLESGKISFWDNEYCGSYDEEIFNIDHDKLGDYVLYGEFMTSGDHVSGDWEVTFRMN